MGKSIMAFGVEPDEARYRLRLARYPSLVASLKRCLEALDSRRPGAEKQPYRLLDIGVGHGRTYKYAAAGGIADRFSWHGVDITHRSKEILAGGDVWTFRQANIEHGIPYEDGHFDVVVSEQILEHLHDVDFAISELSRVTKEGGYLIIGVPVFTCPVAGLRNLYIKYLPGVFERSGSGHCQSFCKRSIIEQIESDETLKVMNTRGFRIVSGGILRPLENHLWWYRLSLWLGKLVPSLCAEIQMVVEKRPVGPVDSAQPGS